MHCKTNYMNDCTAITVIAPDVSRKLFNIAKLQHIVCLILNMKQKITRNLRKSVWTSNHESDIDKEIQTLSSGRKLLKVIIK